MTYFLSRIIAWAIFKICFRYRVKYAKHFPKRGPFIIASNHLSFLDPLAVGIAVKGRVSFLAREDLFKNGLFNFWATKVEAIPIRRARFDLSAIKGSLSKLNEGKIVALFPEGTRSNDGSMQQPKGGVGFLAVKAKVPIVPVLIKGSDKVLPRHSIFIRLKSIEVRVGEAVDPRMFLKENGSYDYQALSQEVMIKIERLGRDKD